MGYFPVEQNLPQNILDELRNISAELERLKAEIYAAIGEAVDGIEIETPEVVLPEFPDFQDSPAWQELQQENRDLREFYESLRLRYDELYSTFQGRINDIQRSITTVDELTTITDRSIASVRQRIDNTIEALRQVMVTVEEQVNDPATGLSSKASVGYVDAVAASIYSASVASFSEISAEFSAVNATLSDLQGTPAFDSGNDYTIGQLVTYNGSLYRAIQNMTNPSPLPTDTAYWDLIGEYSSLAEAVGANSSAIAGLELDIDTKATITQLNTAVADILGAEVAEFTNINAALYDAATGLAVTKASKTELNAAVADIFGAAVSEFTNIDAAINDPITGLPSIYASKTELTQAITDVYGAEVSQFTNIDAALNDPITGLPATYASITALNTAISNVYSAEVSEFSEINAALYGTGGLTDTLASKTEMASAIATAQDAEVSEFSNINAALFDPVTGLAATRTTIDQVNTAIATQTDAYGEMLTLLGSMSGDNSSFILNTATTRVSPTETFADLRDTLETSIGGKASIESFETLEGTVQGIEARAGVRLDVNGYVTGWALNNDGDSGDMVIQVDNFLIVTPGETPTQVFAADALGVYIDTAFIRDLTADKITAGTINANINLTGSINIPTTGNIRSGQTAFNTGTGWWLGHVSGAPALSIGNPAGNRLTYQSGNLYFQGQIVAGPSSSINYAYVTGTKPPANADATQTVIDGGLVTTGYINLATAGNIRSGKSSYLSTTAGFWLGNDGGVPKFHVGNSSRWLRWTGTALELEGPLVQRDNVAEPLSTGNYVSRSSFVTTTTMDQWFDAWDTGLEFDVVAHTVMIDLSFFYNVASWVRAKIIFEQLGGITYYPESETRVTNNRFGATSADPASFHWIIPKVEPSGTGAPYGGRIYVAFQASTTLTLTNLKIRVANLY